jgi:hypothetical protein
MQEKSYISNTELKYASISHALQIISSLKISLTFVFIVPKHIVLGFFFPGASSCVPYVASFSGVSIFDCPFGILYLLFTLTRKITLTDPKGRVTY